MSRIRIPTLLAQGEDDTLFQLHKAVSTYQSLRQQGTPVKMVWQSWGHSQSTPAPSLDFTFFRPLVSYTGDAAAACGRARLSGGHGPGP